MKAILIFWILISLSFLEATLPEPELEATLPGSELEAALPESDPLTSEQKDKGTKLCWSKENFERYLESDSLSLAKILLKMGIQKSPDSVKDMIMDFIRKDELDKFTFMIENGSISPVFDHGLFLSEPYENGQESIVHYLLRSTELYLPYVTKCFSVASVKGYYKLVNVLLKSGKVDPTASKSEALRFASIKGHAKVVDLLLEDKRADPTADKNAAIRFASLNGHFDVVDFLLKDGRADPAAEESAAIRGASLNGHFKVVRLLWNE